MKPFQFIFKGNIYFGVGCRNVLKEIFQYEGWDSACFVIDQGIIDLPIVEGILSSIKKKTIIIECDISEPTYDKLEQKRLTFEDGNIDVFVGIGGGSALDMAKGLSVLFTNEGQRFFASL